MTEVKNKLTSPVETSVDREPIIHYTGTPGTGKTLSGSKQIKWDDLFELNNEVSHGKITFHGACKLYAARENEKLQDQLNKANMHINQTIQTWTQRMEVERNIKETAENNITRTRASAKFLVLRDCIKELSMEPPDNKPSS